MWSDTVFLLFLFYDISNGQIDQASIAEQRQRLIGGKTTLIGGKKLLALQPKKPQFNHEDPIASQRWPNGVVNYYIDENSYDKTIATKLEAAFAALAGDSCPEFKLLSDKPAGDGGSWLHFTNPNRVRPCVHEPGGIGSPNQGETVVVLGYDCLKPQEILHTVMHGLGFHDEVTHPKRDLFVKVMWDDIQPAFRSMFRIRPMREVNWLLDYDPKSVMHFHDHAYSLTGRPSISPLLAGLNIEPSKYLSHIDKMKIRLLFAHECKKRQINKILHSCSTNDNGGGGGGDSNGGGGDGGGSNGGDQILVPGNDVTDVLPDYGEHDDTGENNAANGDGNGDSNQIIAPGNDVTEIASDLNHDENDVAKNDAGNNVSGGNGDKVVVPGNDVSGGNGDEVVVPGNDVSGGNGDEVVVPGKDVSAIHTDDADGVVVEGDNVKVDGVPENQGSQEENDVGSGVGEGTGDDR